MKFKSFTNFLGTFVFNEKGKVHEFKPLPKEPEQAAKILLKKSNFVKDLVKKYPNIRELDHSDFDFRAFALQENIVKNEKDYYHKLQKIAQNYTSLKINESLPEDLYLIELIKLQQALDNSINPLKERLLALKNVKETSYVGRKFEFKIKELKELHDEVEKQVSELAKELMPNVSYILGENLAAHLLSLAGSMQKLARMPSSTIQVLGAEKALFRYLKEQGKAPKHGILFLYPKINGIRKEKRGAMARFVANKLTILSKVDFYGGEFMADQIKKQIEEKYTSLKK